MELAGKPLLYYPLTTMQESMHINEIILVVSPGKIEYCRKEIVEKFHFSKVSKIVEGGAERQQSVSAGLQEISPDCQYVVVHDGARPFLRNDHLEQVVERAWAQGAAILAVPTKNTIKQVDSAGRILSTLEREILWEAQTPQVFRLEELLAAHLLAFNENIRATDDASLLEKIGKEVYVVRGSYENIKITTPEDLIIAEIIIEEKLK